MSSRTYMEKHTLLKTKDEYRARLSLACVEGSGMSLASCTQHSLEPVGALFSLQPVDFKAVETRKIVEFY